MKAVVKSTTNRRTTTRRLRARRAEDRPSRGDVQFALELVNERDEQLYAVLESLERQLAEECKAPGSPISISTWRLAQVALDMVSSSQHLESLSTALRVPDAA
jgi:hypothetical protein